VPCCGDKNKWDIPLFQGNPVKCCVVDGMPKKAVLRAGVEKKGGALDGAQEGVTLPIQDSPMR
jgi:hypothetical protein